ncbi:MAG: hypothetical protein JXL20_04900 [Deltaproteobacteria bacterium]|nr:hypothetical protein [Deltaproteobacteria bacterium]
MAEEKTEQPGKWPVHGWIGLILIALFWVLNWSLSGTRSHWGFFPLWLGYSLTMDALVFRRKGHSLLTRTPGVWAGLFLVSAPAWWLFELINLRTQNWIYLGKESFSTFEYAAFSTLSFSTVMPAVFGTAEWVGTWERVRRLGPGPIIRKTPALLRGLFAAGLLMLLLLLAWPGLFFPLVWGSVYGILEPLNARLGNRSLLDDLARGDWRPVIALSVGCLVCGFFWEMWNFYSWPKWIYRIPYADVFHLFEMPLAGYLGYIPFSLELFALYHLVTGFFRQDKARSDLHLTEV